MSVSGPVSFGDRIRGAIYGALIGDALGVPVEFKARSARDADPVTGMRDGGTWRQPAGTWSDDGALLLCTTEGLLDPYSPDKLGQLYVRWLRSAYWSARDEAFDIGIATYTALERLANGADARASGVTGADQNGNGSLMRILPVGLRHARRERGHLVPRAMEISAITHAHPRSQLACAFYSLIAAEISAGASRNEAWRSAIQEFEFAIESYPEERDWFARTISGSLFQFSRGDLNSTGYVIDTLESALWCLYRHDDFASTVLAAVNLGGDTDTTGCVAGGLAGVLYGFESLPKHWIDALPKQAEIDGLIARFIEVCSVR